MSTISKFHTHVALVPSMKWHYRSFIKYLNHTYQTTVCLMSTRVHKWLVGQFSCWQNFDAKHSTSLFTGNSKNKHWFFGQLQPINKMMTTTSHTCVINEINLTKVNNHSPLVWILSCSKTCTFCLWLLSLLVLHCASTSTVSLEQTFLDPQIFTW